MQGLLEFYASLGDLGPLVIAGVLGVLLIIIALPVMMKKQIDPMAKFRQNVKQPKAATGKGQLLRSGSKADKLEKFKEFLEPKSEEEYSATKLKLLQAGYRGKNAVSTYHFAQFAMGAGLLLLGVGYAIYYSFASQEPTPTQIAIRAIIPGLVGYYLPKYWVTKRQQTRQENITNGFPDALDLMLVCVEAGQSLDQSILRVSKEIRSGFPDLADEFEMIAQETKAGKDKTQVLRDMSERCGVQDVSSFVTVLIQSATFGTSIADALRIYASEMRDKRVMRAEEKANTLPTKMTLATMLLTVPPLLVILIGPSIYEIADTLSGAQFF